MVGLISQGLEPDIIPSPFEARSPTVELHQEAGLSHCCGFCAMVPRLEGCMECCYCDNRGVVDVINNQSARDALPSLQF